MKKRHIKKLRKKIVDENYLMSKLKYWGEKKRVLDNFYRFECSDFFEGTTLAAINRIEYYKRLHVISHKTTQLKRLLKNIGVNI